MIKTNEEIACEYIFLMESKHNFNKLDIFPLMELARQTMVCTFNISTTILSKNFPMEGGK